MIPNPGYVAAALAVAVAITVSLRTSSFVLKGALRDSPLLADLGRWMPLGAITILAIYCLSSINLSGPTHGIPELAGVAVTLAVHLWRHNLVLTLTVGAAVCLALSNGLLPT